MNEKNQNNQNSYNDYKVVFLLTVLIVLVTSLAREFLTSIFLSILIILITSSIFQLKREQLETLKWLETKGGFVFTLILLICSLRGEFQTHMFLIVPTTLVVLILLTK